MGSQKSHIYPKVTKMGSIIDHRIDKNGVGALRGQPAHTQQKIYPSTLHPPLPPPPRDGLVYVFRENPGFKGFWSIMKVTFGIERRIRLTGSMIPNKPSILRDWAKIWIRTNRTGYIEEPCWRPSRVTRALFQFFRATYYTWHVICQSFSCSLFFVRPFVSTPAINLLTYKLKE